MTARMLVSGANGVLGLSVLAELSRTQAPDTEIAGLFRTRASYEEFRLRADADTAARVRPYFADLTDEASVDAVIETCDVVADTVAVHCAADVSWHRSVERMWAPNVTGTLHFCRLVRATARSARLVYVSTAYTRPHDWEYRNAYEETKGTADRRAREDFPDLDPVTFSCSLVVGRTDDGAITRFHGLYPLFRVLDKVEPPFLVGGRSTRIDVVPVDWVTAELVALVHRVAAGRPVDDVVASMGVAAPTFPELLGLVIGALNPLRAGQGRPALGELPVLSFRQWGFLRRSIDAWEVKNVDRTAIGMLERLLRSYGPYLTDDRVLPPSGVSCPAPDPADYLSTVVGYWMDRQRPLVGLETAS